METRWKKQILRIEYNKNGLLHTDNDSTRMRVNSYGRIKIKAKRADTCKAVRLGKECGNPINKGQSAYWEPKSGKIECRQCWE